MQDTGDSNRQPRIQMTLALNGVADPARETPDPGGEPPDPDHQHFSICFHLWQVFSIHKFQFKISKFTSIQNLYYHAYLVKMLNSVYIVQSYAMTILGNPSISEDNLYHLYAHLSECFSFHFPHCSVEKV